MNWNTVEGFGILHLVLPGTRSTVCHYRFNSNCEQGRTDNIRRDITCHECHTFAKVMNIPTA